MSKISALLLVPSLLLLTTSPVFAGMIYNPDPTTGNQVLLPNGGFETGDMSGWPAQVPPDNRGLGLFVASTDQVLSGNYSTKAEPLTSFSGSGFAHITNPFSVTAGEKYVLSGYFYAADLTSGSLYLDLADVGFDTHVFADIGAPGWHFVWEEFTPTGNSLRVRLVRDGNVNAGEFGYIDDVGLTLASEFVAPNQVSAVPEPTTLVLFSIGSVALLLASRRRTAYSAPRRRRGNPATAAASSVCSRCV